MTPSTPFVALTAITLLTQAFASPSSVFVKRATPAPWAGLNVNDDAVHEYCNKPPTQWSVDRRACFTSTVDIKQDMAASDHIYGYMSADGKAFVVSLDLKQAGNGPWTFATAIHDVRIEASQPQCVSVHVASFEADGDRSIDVGGNIFEQCPGSEVINLQ
ncbi:uncharacterized protein UTRI_04991 [Ustilago trichophora]|uniref:Uncharacterized protein n=1 Tax=Ustilago trichophora TaxID=86804 RepID=A0A5C3EBQ7_9BASI|nr:uncharacterized protein UTRI_04991 [Ustilago trichophora]